MNRVRKGTTPQNGIVYFLVAQSGDSLICKIGFTGGNVWDRVSQIQANSPLELDVFGYFPGSLKLERRFHDTFSRLRLHGEWFHVEGKLKDFVWKLASYGAANRLTTVDEMLTAVSDVILAVPAVPRAEHDAYMASAHHEFWEEIFA